MPTALLSVYDKSGIVELASALHEFGWDLVSSGGKYADLLRLQLEGVGARHQQEV